MAGQRDEFDTDSVFGYLDDESDNFNAEAAFEDQDPPVEQEPADANNNDQLQQGVPPPAPPEPSAAPQYHVIDDPALGGGAEVLGAPVDNIVDEIVELFQQGLPAAPPPDLQQLQDQQLQQQLQQHLYQQLHQHAQLPPLHQHAQLPPLPSLQHLSWQARAHLLTPFVLAALGRPDEDPLDPRAAQRMARATILQDQLQRASRFDGDSHANRHGHMKGFEPHICAVVEDLYLAERPPLPRAHMNPNATMPLAPLAEACCAIMSYTAAGIFRATVLGLLGELEGIRDPDAAQARACVFAALTDAVRESIVAQQPRNRINKVAFKTLARPFDALGTDQAQQGGGAAEQRLLPEVSKIIRDEPSSYTLVAVAVAICDTTERLRDAGDQRAAETLLRRLGEFFAGILFFAGMRSYTLGPGKPAPSKKRRGGKKDGSDNDDDDGDEGGGGGSAKKRKSGPGAGAGALDAGQSVDGFQMLQAPLEGGQDDVSESSDGNEDDEDDVDEDDDDDDDEDDDEDDELGAEQGAKLGAKQSAEQGAEQSAEQGAKQTAVAADELQADELLKADEVRVGVHVGVSVELVLGWTQWLRAQVNDHDRFSAMTCYEAVNGFEGEDCAWSVRALTTDSDMSLAQLLRTAEGAPLLEAMVPGEAFEKQVHVGAPQLFMSHAWQTPITVMASALDTPQLRAKRVWLDVFAVPQTLRPQESEAQKQAVMPQMQAAIAACSEGLLLLAHPWDQPVALKRTWCWVEIAVAADAHKPLTLALSQSDKDGLRKLAETCVSSAEPSEEDGVAVVDLMLRALDVTNSRCTSDVDKVKLHNYISGTHGTQQVNRVVKGAVADVLLRTVDTFVAGAKSSRGAVRLVETVANATLAASGNMRAALVSKLARLHATMGNYEASAAVLEQHVEQARDMIRDTGAAAAKSELAEALNLRGRAVGEAARAGSLSKSIADLEEAVQLREELNDAGLHEALFNLGRMPVLYYEKHEQPPPGRDRARDLARAKSALRRSVKLQEAMSPTPGSLGAACVLLAKALDLVGGQKKERALALFERGKEVQLRMYGYEDARWAMTEQSLAWHFITHGRFELALPRLALAHAHLLPRALGAGGRPTSCPRDRIVYQLNMIRTAVDGARATAREDLGYARVGEGYANEARRFMRWLAERDAELLQAHYLADELRRVREWIAEAATPERVLVALADSVARQVLASAVTKAAGARAPLFKVETCAASEAQEKLPGCALVIVEAAEEEAARGWCSAMVAESGARQPSVCVVGASSKGAQRVQLPIGEEGIATLGEALPEVPFPEALGAADLYSGL